jgi:hypothetical protein
MATMAALSGEASASNEAMWNSVREKLESVNTRTTTVAAEELFAGSPSTEEWRTTLPQRLERLCQVLESWVRVCDDGCIPLDYTTLPHRAWIDCDGNDGLVAVPTRSLLLLVFYRM